ncbi:MAG: response regulator [Campylobacterota bacterium]|nr:response regulator [Campylobacterota bacterium]
MFNLSIKTKLFLLFIIVILVSVSSVGWFGFKSAKDSYINSAFLVNKGEMKALGNKIQGVLGTIPDDVIYNSNFYALEKLLIWEDLKEQKEIEKWKKVYISALKDYIENKKLYYQVRILDINGNEKILLKYDYITKKVLQSDKNKLQNKSNRDYFKKAISLQKGEFYISNMNLNVEHGQIEKPHIPVVRYSTPLVDKNGETKGVIVLNFNATILLNMIRDTKAIDETRDVQKYYLLNKDGYYLFIEDKIKRWGFQLGTEYNFKNDYEGVLEKFKDKDEITFIEDNKIFSMNKVYPNKVNNSYRYWYLVTQIDTEVALESLDEFINIFFIILFSVLAIGLFLINSVISKITISLLKVKIQLNRLSKGEIQKENIIYNSNDEVGQIVKSTNILVDAIETTINQANLISSGDFTKDITLLSKNDKLGLAITSMTKRLKEITSLAKTLSVGNYDVKVIVKSNDDELGKALVNMVKYLENITKVAESISLGQIDIRYKAQSSDDRLGYAILQMIKYLKNILKQAQAITNKDFTNSINIKSKDDELGEALVNMTTILASNNIKTKNEVWLSEGLASLTDKLTGIDDILILSKKSIDTISRYLNASSGVLYTIDKDEDELSLIASFAFISRDSISNRFKLGEGIVGQVALEQQEILLRNIKDSSYQVQTGTTISTPKEIYAFPFIYEGELFGVIELMTYESFTDEDKIYLKKASNILSTIFHSTIQNIKIKTLLKESQEAFEELQVKSEEMQAQSEELRATNEQMEEQQQQLELQSNNLQVKNEEINKAKQDIDKKAKDLEISNKYKSEFLANMSHELRTPLNSVILLSSLLSKNSKNNLNQSDIQKANVINESGNELLRLINDILDLSKIESGKMELIIDKIDSNNLIKYYEETFKHTAIDKGLEFNIIDNIKDTFYNDKDRLGQVIRNLISNAFKFTKDGSVDLIFDKTSDEKLPIKISVKDTGLGIRKDKQELIFKAFTQADGSTSRQFGGTGLGLSISKELAHLMKGEISLKSVLEEGSTFSILLPNLKSLYKQKDIKVKDEVIEIENNNIKKINSSFLIIEDDKTFANVLKTTVEEYGATVHIANSGYEGLELAKKYKIDGAIIDIGLPDISGIDVIKELKSDSLTKGIHIQVISGEDNNILNLDDIKIDGYLQKPVSSKQINNAISHIKDLDNNDLKSILIVEDDIIHLNAIQDYLKEDNNYDIEVAKSVAQAKDKIKNKYYNIAIVDLGLGDDSGSEICKYLTNYKKDTSVLIYTGRDLSSEEVDFLNDISDEVIIKNPNSHERLKDEIERFITSPKLTVNERFKQHIEDIDSLDSKDFNKNDLKDKSVLIVDDDIKNIFVLTSALQEFDMKISHSKNGKEALEYLENNPTTDIVLMDIMMPVMNGYEAIEAIREDKNLKHLPIIAVTAKAMQKDKDKALDSGADDYLTKPIDLEKLTSMMIMWINK